MVEKIGSKTIDALDRKWIEKVLDKFDFVEWDRFSSFKHVVRVYGWIDREEDDYKDFVHLEFNLKSKDVLFLGSSSSKYDEEIMNVLNDVLGNKDCMVECERVENHFDDLENVVVLDE